MRSTREVAGTRGYRAVPARYGAGNERAARALIRATATALHGCHHFQWCGVEVPGTTRPADPWAKPPLEVVAPMLAVDARAKCSRFALVIALVIAPRRKRPAGDRRSLHSCAKEAPENSMKPRSGADDDALIDTASSSRPSSLRESQSNREQHDEDAENTDRDCHHRAGSASQPRESKCGNA